MMAIERPSLHEIAAMPFPESEKALHKFYGVPPKREHREGEMKTYKVKVKYSETIRETITYDVEAASPKDAEEVAMEMFDKEPSIDHDADVDDICVSEVAS